MEAVERFEQEVRKSGIEIVPFFMLNGRVTVGGAHEVRVLVEAMERATKGETDEAAG